MNKNEFRMVINDISQKVQNCKMILTSKEKVNIFNKTVGVGDFIEKIEVPVPKLKNKFMFDLIKPTKKDVKILKEEFDQL